MRKLIVIYGSPRTGTSHIFRVLIRHPRCFGTEHGHPQGDREFSCNEPFDIDYTGSPENTKGIDKRWDRLYEPGKEYLVLKAPGYCMAWDYFSNLKNYECKYVFTDRNAVEVVNSLSKREKSNAMADSSTAKGRGCPDKLLSVYEPLWEKSSHYPDDIRRLKRHYYAYRWHLESIPFDMYERSLRLIPYEYRLCASKVAGEIDGYIGSAHRGEWYNYLMEFNYRKLTYEKQKYLMSILSDERR